MKENKHLIIFILLVILSCKNSSTNSEKENEIVPKLCVVSGHVKLNFNKAYLHQLIDGESVVIDSVNIINGSFIFNPIDLTPQILKITFDNSQSIAIFVENDSVQLDIYNISNDSIVVKNSIIHQEWVSFNKLLHPFDIQLDSVVDLYEKAVIMSDEKLISKYKHVFDEIDSLKNLIIAEYVNEHPKSYLSPYLIIRYLAFTSNIDELESLKSKLDESVKNSVYVTL